MLTVPAPTHAQEEWPDADFELPEGDVIRPPPDAESDKEDEEDWEEDGEEEQEEQEEEW